MSRMMSHILLARLLVAALLLAPPAACSRPAETGASDPSQTTATRGPVELTVTVDSDTIETGTPLTVELRALAPNDVELAMPLLEVPQDALIAGFHVLENELLPDYPDGERRAWTQRMVLDTFETGTLQIPGVTARFTDQRGAIEVTGSVTTDPIGITVRSFAAEDTAGLRDIRGPVSIPLTNWGLWLLLGGVVLLAAGIVIMQVVRRRERGTSPPLPPHILAQRQLDALESERLLERRCFQPYYVRLTDILRHYIEGRFGLLAPTRTTPEFLDDMRCSDALLAPQQAQLHGFLRIADLVKFARHEPPIDEGEEALHVARCFVVDTQPRTETAEETD